MRSQPNQADIQVNLLPAKQRSVQSHAIAKRRPLLVAIGNEYGARIQVSEVPPGPPVIQTLVAEVYGPDLDGQTQVAQQIKHIFQSTPGVVDTDWYVEDPQPVEDAPCGADTNFSGRFSPTSLARLTT